MMKLMSCRNGVFMVIKNVLILYVYMELISIIKVIVLFIFVVVLSLFDIFRKGQMFRKYVSIKLLIRLVLMKMYYRDFFFMLLFVFVLEC